MSEMNSASLVELLKLLENHELSFWLDGGWGVDALLQKQSRPHKDVDLILQVSDVPKVREILASKAFVLTQGNPPNSFVLGNEAGLEVHIHAVVFDEDGNGVYRMENGQDWIYPAEGFEGRGVVAGLSVHCLAPEIQVLCHAGLFTPSEKDFSDMELLRQKFGVALPPQLKPSQG